MQLRLVPEDSTSPRIGKGAVPCCWLVASESQYCWSASCSRRCAISGNCRCPRSRHSPLPRPSPRHLQAPARESDHRCHRQQCCLQRLPSTVHQRSRHFSPSNRLWTSLNVCVLKVLPRRNRCRSTTHQLQLHRRPCLQSRSIRWKSSAGKSRSLVSSGVHRN